MEVRPEGSLNLLRNGHSSAVKLLSTAAATPARVHQYGAGCTALTQPWAAQAGLVGTQWQNRKEMCEHEFLHPIVLWKALGEKNKKF